MLEFTNSMIDAVGMELYNENITNSKQLNIPLSSLKTGFYFVNIEGYEWEKTVKIIKQ